MRILGLRITTRQLMFFVGVLAVLFGAVREWRRIRYFLDRAEYYRREEESIKTLGILSGRSPRIEEADERARRAEIAGTLARWYSSHLLTGSTPPADPDERLQGWSIPEASRRCGVIVEGTLTGVGWWGTDATFQVTRVLKGRPRDQESTTVSTRYVPDDAVVMRKGSQYLVFYVEFARLGNLAVRVLERTKENLEALEKAIGPDSGLASEVGATR